VQRREHGRYRLWFPVQVASGPIDGMAFNQNISAGGMLVAVSARLEVDAKVTVRFQIPPNVAHEHVVEGRVLRIEPNAEDPDGIWPYRIAVAFEAVDEALVPYLERAADHLSSLA
jgi:hypothetical protein